MNERMSGREESRVLTKSIIYYTYIVTRTITHLKKELKR